MTGRARRLPARSWPAIARRALLALCLWQPVQVSADTASICAATYAEPTSDYPHGVLGDELEWAALDVIVGRKCNATASASFVTYRLKTPSNTVFEDLAPRLWDVSGDGEPEVVVVRSHQRFGGQLVIYGLNGVVPVERAATPPIGQRFRWLAPVAAADLDGDGHVEIAYVDRPHLAKTLRIWRYRDETLSPLFTVPDMTNHRIGWNFVVGGLKSCKTPPVLVAVSGDWRRVIEVTLQDGAAVSRDIGPYQGPESVATALRCD